MAEIKLSVLLCGLYERMVIYGDGVASDGDDLLRTLHQQADGKPVEILYLMDNMKMSVGRKRNILLAIAQGEWIAFVDDDDEVAVDYVDQLLGAIDVAGDAGVICFPQTCHHADTGEVETCTYGLSLPYSKQGTQWTGLPAHTQCWRTEAVQGIEFPEQNFQEDTGWVAKAVTAVSKEYRIEVDHPLYVYRFDPKTSRTRG